MSIPTTARWSAGASAVWESTTNRRRLGSIPEILDSFELHRYSAPYTYRNNRYGYSLEEGFHYYLATSTEEHDFAFFWGYEG